MHCRDIDPVLAEHFKVIGNGFRESPSTRQLLILIVEVYGLRFIEATEEKIGMRPIRLDPYD
jgi:hypothetical protein